MLSRSLTELLFHAAVIRWVIALAFLCRGTARLALSRRYRALIDFCWIERVSRVGPLRRIARAVVFGVIDATRREGRNAIVESFRADPASATSASEYSVSGSGSHDLFRDVMVLKGWTPDEKGVILLKYVKTFDAVLSILDVSRVMERYVFVLEPCWAGYCDPSLLMFVTPGHPVVVQCFTEEDYRFVEQIGAPLVPVRLGPADWVNADLFRPSPGETKPYDVVMVANWGPHKRHAQLFRALKRIRNRTIRVLLIGFPWSGRTAADILREAATIDNERVTVDVVENLSPQDVASHVSRCKVFVFLSRKEGDNKALVEAMFVDVPAIVYNKTVGGARSRITSATGVLSGDEELPETIEFMLDHYPEFSPRAWALAHTGSAVATRVLNETLRRAVLAAGGRYTEGIVEKTNAPNLAYKLEADRVRFQADYAFILECRRERPYVRRSAVA